MKNQVCFLILFSFLVLTNKTFSQSYRSLFGTTSTSWDVILQGHCDAICSQTITAGGDTAIGSNTYKVISGLPGFVREDSVQGKVWFFDTYNNTEYLIMDLALSLGDTFNLYNFNNVASPFIVDSVYYAGNKKHVRLNALTAMCVLIEKITFIEGSGTTAGFSYQRDLNWNSVSSYMLCHHKNGVKVEGNYLFMDTCYSCSVGIQENNHDFNSIKIFPNPATGYLNIDMERIPSGNCFMTLYNMLGEKLISQRITDIQTIINVSDLNKGIYTIVIGDNASKKHQRFIKQ